MKKLAMLLVVGLSLVLTACTTTTFQGGSPEVYRLPALTIFEAASQAANKEVVFTIGYFEDKTGKFMDSDQLRYSRAITQSGRDLVAHFLKEGGFRVVERDPYNIQLIAQEYKMSHTYIFDKDGGVKEQAGLIKRGGLDKGLTGAGYMVTGAITTYQVSTRSGGGGLEVDAIGIQVKFTEAIVGVNLRIVDLNTSEVINSTLEVATVLGRKIGLNGFKLITHGGEFTVVGAEAGLASQFPADFALKEAMIQGLARLLTAPGTDFYKGYQVDFSQMLKPAAKPSAPEKKP